MISPRFRYSLLAYSIAQAFAFSSSAIAQTAENTLPEVVVSAGQDRGDTASVGGFSEAPLMQTPASVSVITKEQMENQGIRTTTDVVKYDASLNEAYNAIGYAEQFSIRGFALDNFSSYRKDGLAISSDASIPLENKERIEVLKGLAGLQAGITTPGGLVNYVTKRPTDAPLRTATIGASERGTLYSAVDLGGRFEDQRFGYRINAAAERLRSYVKGADGDRQFVSGAFDWRISSDSLMELDFDYQHKSQVTAAGYQLLGGTTLPTGINPKVNLNDQPWTRPVESDTGNVGMRFEHKLDEAWKTILSANWYKTRRDDYAAFPAGCGAIYPGFCANGDYDLYDYKSENEAKTIFSTQALLQGTFQAGSISHDLTTGIATQSRRDRFGDMAYDWVDNGNMYNPTVNLSGALIAGSSNTSGPVSLRRRDTERSIFVQDIIGLNDQWKVHAGLRYVETNRDQFDATSLTSQYEKEHVLPNLAVVFSPSNHISLYGSYSEGLEHGGIAPLWATNEFEMLDPAKSRQVEFGIKANLSNDVAVSAAIFNIRKPHEYNRYDPVAAVSTYVRSGDAVHRGIELSAQGRINPDLQVGASLMALDAETRNTGDVNIEGKRVSNVPELKSTVYADYTLRNIPGLSVNGSWQYSGDKDFAPNSYTRAEVPGYSVFNAGLRYATSIGGHATTLRFNVYNLFNKFYWRDASSLLDGYLLAGAPRTYSISAQMDF